MLLLTMRHTKQIEHRNHDMIFFVNRGDKLFSFEHNKFYEMIKGINWQLLFR